MFNGPHPERPHEELTVVDQAPPGVPAHDLPPQTAVFAPDYAPEEIAAIARKLRKRAGLSDTPLGEVAGNGTPSKAKRSAAPSGKAKGKAKAKAS